MGTQQTVLLPLARPAGSQQARVDRQDSGQGSTQQGRQSSGDPAQPLAVLRAELAALRTLRGGPSTRTLARLLSATATNLSHNTVNLTLRCDRPPQWINLKAVVRALDGDVDQFHRLWSATQTGPNGGADRQASGRFKRRTAGTAKALVAGAMDPNGVRHLYCGRGDGQLHELWFAPDLGQQRLPSTDGESIVAMAGLCCPDGDQFVAWATEDGRCNVTKFGPLTPANTVTVEEFRAGVTTVDCVLDLAGDLVVSIGTADGGVHVATRNTGQDAGCDVAPEAGCDAGSDVDEPLAGRWSIRTVGRFSTPILAMASHVDRAGGLHVFFSTEDGMLRQTRVRPIGARTAAGVGTATGVAAATVVKTRVRAVSPTAIEAVACGVDDQEVTHVYWGNRDGNLYQTWLKRDETGTRRVARFNAPVIAIAAGLCGRRDGTHLAFSATDDGRIRSTRFGFGIPPHDRDVVASPGPVTSLHAQQAGLDRWEIAWGTASGQVYQAGLDAGQATVSMLLGQTE